MTVIVLPACANMVMGMIVQGAAVVNPIAIVVEALLPIIFIVWAFPFSSVKATFKDMLDEDDDMFKNASITNIPPLGVVSEQT